MRRRSAGEELGVKLLELVALLALLLGAHLADRRLQPRKQEDMALYLAWKQLNGGRILVGGIAAVAVAVLDCQLLALEGVDARVRFETRHRRGEWRKWGKGRARSMKELTFNIKKR